MSSPAVAAPTTPGLGAVGYRVVCDAIVGGLLTVVAGIWFGGIVERAEPDFAWGWQFAFVGLVLIGAVSVLLFRTQLARRVAIVAQGLAIVQIAITQGWLFHWRPSTSAFVFDLLTLMTLVPAIALTLLYVDFCFVARPNAGVSFPRITWGTRVGRSLFYVGMGLCGMTTTFVVVQLGEPLLTQVRSLGWPTAVATIVNSNAAPGEGKEPATVEVEYVFEVGGVRQTCRRLTTLPQWFTHYGDQEAEQLAARLTPGVRLPAAYHPADPSRCLLFPGIRGKDLVFLLKFSFYSCVCIGYFLMMLQNERGWIDRTPSGERPGALIGMEWLTFGLAACVVAPVTLALTGGTPSYLAATAAWGGTLAVTIAFIRWLKKKQAAEASLAGV